MEGFTLTILAGATTGTASFDLIPIDGDIDELQERVRLSITSSDIFFVIPPGLIVFVEDNDPMPELSQVLTPASISVNGGTSTVTATLRTAPIA